MSVVDIECYYRNGPLNEMQYVCTLSILSTPSGDQEEWDALLSCEFVCECKWLGGCIYEQVDGIGVLNRKYDFHKGQSLIKCALLGEDAINVLVPYNFQ